MAIFSPILLFALCFMVGVNAQELQEKDVYCNLDPLHILCRYDQAGPSSACTGAQIITLSQADKDAIVAKHNELRSKVALGNEGSLPKATNMRKMVWDNELQAMAQRWVDQCIKGHYNPYPGDKMKRAKYSRVPRFYVGENIARSWASEVNWASRVEGWYTKEIAGVNEGMIDSYPNGKNPFGHATQVLWAESYAVGCGITQQTDGDSFKFVLVCNYGPGGNMAGSTTYVKGDPSSSDCPNGTQREDSSGLCAQVV